MHLELIGPWLFGLMAVGVFGFVVGNLLLYRALARRGTSTSGLVIGIEQEADNEAEAIVVVFEDRGKSHQISSRGAMTGWGRKVGRKVTVTYDPANPDRARILEDVRLQTWVGTVMGLVWVAASVALLLE